MRFSLRELLLCTALTATGCAFTPLWWLLLPGFAVYLEWRDRKPVVRAQRPFGWLLLGMACGLLGGHALAYLYLIPLGYASMYMERLAAALIIGAVAGAALGAVAERLLKRVPVGHAWIVLLTEATAYYLIYGAAAMFAARE